MSESVEYYGAYPVRVDKEWSLVTLFVNEKGKIHDDEGESAPSIGETERAWEEYWAFVRRTGIDPLDQAIMKKVNMRRERWEIMVKPSVAGIQVIGSRRGTRGPFGSIHMMPEQARFYFLLDLAIKTPNGYYRYPRDIAPNIESFIKTCGQDPNCSVRQSSALRYIISAVITAQQPRSPKAIRRELLDIAGKIGKYSRGDRHPAVHRTRPKRPAAPRLSR